MLNSSFSPALKSHFEAQLSFFYDLSRQAFNTAQQLNELNLRMTQNFIEDSISNTQRLLNVKDPGEFLSIAAAQAQPAAEKVRVYQQGISSIAAGTQAEIAKAAESHIPEASRTAAAVVDEVSKRTSEAAERARQMQRNALDKTANPAARAADAAQGAASQQRH